MWGFLDPCRYIFSTLERNHYNSTILKLAIIVFGFPQKNLENTYGDYLEAKKKSREYIWRLLGLSADIYKYVYFIASSPHVTDAWAHLSSPSSSAHFPLLATSTAAMGQLQWL
jgi:hypothetical protein